MEIKRKNGKGKQIPNKYINKLLLFELQGKEP